MERDDDEMYDSDEFDSYEPGWYKPDYSAYAYKRDTDSPSANLSNEIEPVLSYNLKYIPGDASRKCIDLAFVLDCTGSMQKYIDATRDHIVGICDMIRGEEGLGSVDDLRVALVNYRDHPPQDHSYVTKFHPFTSDIQSIQTYIQGLRASGGGDGPEAVTAGLSVCLTDLEWRSNAAKMVVLIADAPPHGIGESGDGIKTGDPQGHDPLVIARTMASNGITLFMVACEETLSSYSRAVDFFQALCALTSGVMLPLMTADMLAMTIVGSVSENMDMERLIQEIGSEVALRIRSKGESMQSVEEVAQELHERLLLRNEKTKQVHLPEVYEMPDEAKQNVQIWMGAHLIRDAAPNIIYIAQKRLTEKFRKQNRESGYQYTGRTLPPRPSAIASPPTPSTPGHSGTPGATSPPSYNASMGHIGAGSAFSPPGTPTNSAADRLRGNTSPSRGIVTDFKPFGSPATSASFTGSAGQGQGSIFGAGAGAGAANGGNGNASGTSVFGTKVLKTGPGGGMFGNLGAGAGGGFGGARDRPRGGWGMDDDDDEDEGMGGFGKGASAGAGAGARKAPGLGGDEDDDYDLPGLRKDNISLDQARRIATQAVFRAGRLG